MRTDLIYELTETFESCAQQTDDGVEFWLARDLQHLLGYAEWRNFTLVIGKAKTACEVSDQAISDHFVDVNKMVELGSDSQREVNVKKVERRLTSDQKKSLKNPDGLNTGSEN